MHRLCIRSSDLAVRFAAGTNDLLVIFLSFASLYRIQDFLTFVSKEGHDNIVRLLHSFRNFARFQPNCYPHAQ
jgi:hypothetical protein